jgi:glycosyltransferase involved in cell wall biosynthesis
MTEPLVSVKMITYNHASFIREAVESIVNQRTDFPFELVIGEDCSTDGTREIVFEYQEKYPHIIRVITSDKNVGAKKNSRRTSKAVRGKYIAFCEGDDYWHNQDKLQKQADYLENHPDCGLVHSSYDVYHVKSGKRITDFINYRQYRIPENPSVSDIVDGKGRVLTCTVMVRRALCEEISEADPYLHQSDHFLMGDTQLWAEMAAKSRLHFIPASLATHIITEESATRSKHVRKILRFEISGAELQLYLCSKYNLPRWLRDKYDMNLAESSLLLALHDRNTKLADEIRDKKKKMTLKEWAQYFGANSLAMHYMYRGAASVLDSFRKKHDEWL